ncbi:MAG: hypothetical protein IKQ09_05450 [Bacteroidales bacterium]|nr:hypothetical protein [Bacteroidales bacterium]
MARFEDTPLLKSVAKNVKITMFSDNINHNLYSAEFSDFQKKYPDVNYLGYDVVVEKKRVNLYIL